MKNIRVGKSSPKLVGRNLRAAVVGGGPAGGAAAETLAKGGIETVLIKRKLDNCKPCGGAIPLCMVRELDLPLDIIDRKVTKMKMISPSNVAVDIGRTFKPHEYIGMVRREVLDRVALVGDAAGYVTKCSGEGIYFAAKSRRMCAEALIQGSENGTRMINEADLRKYLNKFDQNYWPTYKVLDVLQKVFYRSNPAREASVEMCADEYVQKMTFDSYLYKRVVPGNPLEDLKLAVSTIGCLVRANALRKEMSKITL